MEIEDLPVLLPTQNRLFIRTVPKNSILLLTNVIETSILDAAGFLDLPLVTEKIDLGFVL